MDGEGKEREVLVEARAQNLSARLSAVLSSEGHCDETHPTISLVKFLLTQKQFTSTTLVQLAAELPRSMQVETQDEYPLKLGNIAELVALAVVEFPLPLMLDEEVVLESPKEDGGTKVGDGFADGFAHAKEEI